MRHWIDDKSQSAPSTGRAKGRDPNFSAILPLRGKAELKRSDLLDKLREELGESGPEVTVDPLEADIQTRRPWLSLGSKQPEAFLFSIDSIRMLVTLEHKKFEDGGGVHGFINPNIWNKGISEASEHTSCLTILELSDAPYPHPDEVFDRAVAVTMTAAAAAKIMPATCVLWQPAQNALPIDIFEASVADLRGEVPPLLLWTRWNMIPPKDTEEKLFPGLATRGLAPLIGREIIAPPSRIETGQMLENVFRLATRMIDWRSKPCDGAIIGKELPTRLKLRRKSIYSARPFYELVPMD
ncbi:MAG: hypothetical protein AAGE80_12570 [Pseudomonadota bacterium]